MIMNIFNTMIETSIQESFNLVTFFNSREYQKMMRDLKNDKFLYSIFNDRIKYLSSLDKRYTLDKIQKIAFRYSVKLKKGESFSEKNYRDNYLSNNYDSYDLNQLVSDFKYNFYLIKNMLLAKNTKNNRYLILKSIVEKQLKNNADFIKKGSPLDFYCHDYERLATIDNLCEYVWLTRKDYLSTHVMKKSDYEKFIKSIGCEYIIVDLNNMTEIKKIK